MRPGPRRLLALAFSAAALAAGWLATGPPDQLPAVPTAAFALQALVTSAPPQRRGRPQAAAAAVTVASGDSLSLLAARYYHHQSWWPRIWWANRAAIHNPNLVPAGAQLVIPAPHHPRWTTTRAAWSAIPPPPPPPAPAAPAPAPQAPAAAAGPAPAAPPAAPAATYSGGSGFQACVISRESGGNPSAVNPSSGAGGLYQFLPSTWAALGHSGSPQNASVAEQNQAFAQEYAQSGTSAWSPYDGC